MSLPVEPLRPISDSGASRRQQMESLADRFSHRGIRRQRRQQTVQLAAWYGLIQPLKSGKRILDGLIALTILTTLSPLLVILRLVTGPIRRTERVGRWCEPFLEYSFSTDLALVRGLRLHRLPALLNVLKGDMAFIGPRVVSPGELSPRERAARKRYDVRPGFICLWWVRRRANIAYETESISDSEYVESQSLKGDLGIALRAIPAILYGEGVPTAPDSVTLLRIPVNNVTMSEAVGWIVDRMRDNAPPAQLAFVNADCANIAYVNDEYATVLKRAEYVLADGIGMKIAGKLLRQEIKQNVNGTDLFPRLCAALEATDMGVYLLGGKPGVADGVANWIRANYPGVRLAGTQHGYYAPEEEANIVTAIRESGARLVLVAFGAPRQDLWVAKHLTDLGAPVAMGVGGLFDFYSGNKPRAPQWVREIGMEWAFRLVVEPQRLWKRYVVGNAVFLSRVLWERVRPDDRRTASGEES
ncbi:MAG: WecB/TagA/CpsF family glycosyltransferase [Capsulimonadales bacterium]|nr:WecB/TagA/CpsF family glycosyltransferase [Capsulimonadales bacterium]